MKFEFRKIPAMEFQNVFRPPAMEVMFHVNAKTKEGDSGSTTAPLSAKPYVMRRKKGLCF